MIVLVETTKSRVETLCDVLDKIVQGSSFRLLRVVDVCAGRVEQGIVKPGEEIVFLPTPSDSKGLNSSDDSVRVNKLSTDDADQFHDDEYKLEFQRKRHTATAAQQLQFNNQHRKLAPHIVMNGQKEKLV